MSGNNNKKQRVVYRDELKVDEKKATKRADTIATIEAVLNKLITKPSTWNNPELDNVKSMICKIGRDNNTYPLPLGEDATYTPNHTEVQLTKGVATQLYKREDDSYNDFIIQISVTDYENKNMTIDGAADMGGDTIHQRVWKLNAVDGDNNTITIRLDSTLNSEAALLSEGTVIKVESAFSIYMNYGDLYDDRCALVLRDFKVLCRRSLPIQINGPPKRLKVAEVQSKPAATNSNCECTGNLCSQHGIDFVVCLTKCVPISGLSLKKIARECVFVSKELKDMKNKEKRFLLYYYYATSVYQFHGRGNRVVLPECLVTAIRNKYPDE